MQREKEDKCLNLSRFLWNNRVNKQKHLKSESQCVYFDSYYGMIIRRKIIGQIVKKIYIVRTLFYDRAEKQKKNFLCIKICKDVKN